MSKELKINPRFEKFSPLKKQDEMDKLENSLIKNGYKGAPIQTWHGYIVDGHNRYRLCKKLNIEIKDSNIQEIDLGDSAAEIDAMDWMLTIQLSSKNLSVGEKLAMMDSLKEEIKKNNEKIKNSNFAHRF